MMQEQKQKELELIKEQQRSQLLEDDDEESWDEQKDQNNVTKDEKKQVDQDMTLEEVSSDQDDFDELES